MNSLFGGNNMGNMMNMLQKFNEFRKTMTPQGAEKKINEMLSNGQMPLAELTHARYLKEMGEQCWAELSQTYTAHAVVEDWEKCVNKYTDKVAGIKQMLAM